MRSPLPAAKAPLALAATVASLALLGCGDDDSSGGEPARPAPEATAFPAPDGRTIEELGQEYGSSDDELVVSPAGQVFTEGRNRFGFGVFRVDRSQVTDADIAIYAAPAAGGKAEGPFPARVESLVTEPAFTARNTAADPDAAKAVYVSDLQFDRPGPWRLLALVREGESYTAVPLQTDAIVTRNDAVPAPGEQAPVVHTPTADDVSDISEIDTRVPPSTMHEEDLADVLGKKPVVLLFATPALCQSRVCGPVVDVAEQVKRDYGDEAAFIQMEIYNENLANKGLRPQVEAYRLPTEPWLFVIDEDGRISTRIEGAFSVAELEDALARVNGSGKAQG